MEDNKIFVFLSHSHLDYEKVRVVRDLLEKEGFRPLMFFLKCLEKDGYEELTRKLIKEEIDSRHRFILCNSENAQGSDWVQFEVEHIKKTNRPYEIVDLDWPEEKIEEAIHRFKVRSTVFLSYSRRDLDLVRVVNDKLKLHDFKTFIDQDVINSNSDFVETITKGIDKAAKEGYVLAFLTENGIKSEWVLHEIMYAIKREGRIILIVSGPMPNNIEFLLHNYNNRIDIQNMSVSEAADYIVDSLLRIDSKNNQ